jgi:fructuronate reductase
MSAKRLNSALAKELQLDNKSISDNKPVKQIVHLGLGAFHRAHQAVYTEKSNEATADNWQIVGVSLRSGNVRDQLAPQDGLYSVIETDITGNTHSVMSVITNLLFAPENRAVVLSVM